jgi:hypothetical protein
LVSVVGEVSPVLARRGEGTECQPVLCNPAGGESVRVLCRPKADCAEERGRRLCTAYLHVFIKSPEQPETTYCKWLPPFQKLNL